MRERGSTTLVVEHSEKGDRATGKRRREGGNRPTFRIIRQIRAFE